MALWLPCVMLGILHLPEIRVYLFVFKDTYSCEEYSTRNTILVEYLHSAAAAHEYLAVQVLLNKKMQLYRAQILKALAYHYSLVGSHRLIIVEYFRDDLAVFFHERRECLRRYLGIAHAYHQIVLENGYQEFRKHRPDDIVLPVLPLGERGDEHIGAACPAAEFTIEGYALRYGCIFSGFAVKPHAGGLTGDLKLKMQTHL